MNRDEIYRELNEERYFLQRHEGTPRIMMRTNYLLDHNKKNNHPDNLTVMTQSEHARLHHTKDRKCEMADCDRKHSALGLCERHYSNLKYQRKILCQS